MELATSHIAVTGGGSGLGEATARTLVAHGARVTVIDRNKAAAERVAADISGHALELDVTDEAAGSALDGAISSHGPLRGLVNC
ncbi:SDR family NAD(P)-dependent oxidoreductase, partial [Rhizobium rhizoryzae]|uniref:SDR family NAD(P)-dependent oxidoreductase n=1 Tax=Rhizobium rhizoryzae TaxID=451876 RepID=UPI0028A9D73B